MTKVYLEIGKTRTFAVALDWPGWARSGRGEAAALQALCDYGPRYKQALGASRLGFHPPTDVSAFKVVERLKGNATTDFGAPDVALSSDTEPVDPEELKRWEKLLKACWQTFDASVEAASGKTLKKGPRGGGRDLAKIIEHVQDVDVAYLKSLGGTLKASDADNPERIREAILTTLNAAVRGEIPAHGPRGGVRWTPRYFVRRLAWHELDHAWEIEDKAE
jgi:hypothetical protein